MRGGGAIVVLSKHILHHNPDASGFSSQNLRRMRQLCGTRKDDAIRSALLRELSWTHDSMMVGSKDDAVAEYTMAKNLTLSLILVIFGKIFYKYSVKFFYNFGRIGTPPCAPSPCRPTFELSQNLRRLMTRATPLPAHCGSSPRRRLSIPVAIVTKTVSYSFHPFSIYSSRAHGRSRHDTSEE